MLMHLLPLLRLLPLLQLPQPQARCLPLQQWRLSGAPSAAAATEGSAASEPAPAPASASSAPPSPAQASAAAGAGAGAAEAAEGSDGSWVATDEWFLGVKDTLHLSPILSLIDYLVPRVEAFVASVPGGAVDDEGVIAFLKREALVGILPLPEPIV